MDSPTPTPIGGDDRRALVKKLLERRGIRTAGDRGIPPRRSGEPIPLSFPQQRLWFLHHLQPDTSAYNLTAALRLSGQLDSEALAHALDEVVARHDALRMAFPTVDGQGVVDLRPHVAVPIEAIDVSGVQAPDGESALRLALETQAHRPFDLAEAPLFRVALIRLSADEHVLALTAHHIVFDGWSIAVFVRELAAAYQHAHQNDLAESRGPLERGYADFSAWQRARHEAGEFDADLAYWTRQLADLAPLVLPTDRPRSARPTHRGSSLTFAIPASLVRGLRDLARSCHATPFMALLAGFTALLGRYTGRSDVAVGSPIAGRSRPELEPLIGLFANTLVLRADLSGEPSFTELLGRIRLMTEDAYAHQDAQFEYLVERLQPERRLSQQPLFQVAFAMQHEGIGALSLQGLEVQTIDVPSVASKFDVTMALTDQGETIAGSVEFNADLFDRSTIERMVGHYLTLLSAAVATPQVPVARLPILAPDERRTILADWSGAASAPAAAVDGCLHETFERRAAERPDAIALQLGAERLTYADLNARANRLAWWLKGMGIGTEDRVALFLERSLDSVVSILAVLKAGAAYVPIDPVNPADRVRLILEDSGVRLLLTADDLVNRLPADAMRSIPTRSTESLREELAHQRTENIGAGSAPADLAYVIYTSGSTGRPKGTLIQHDHVRRLFTSTNQWFAFGPSDVWTLFHSYGFDFSVWEIWGALLYGGRLVIVPYLISRSPADFHELLAREGVTVLNQTPSAFSQLIDADSRGSRPLALRFVIFGGEALELESLRPWFERHGDARPRVVNMYGITETTVHVTYRPIGLGDLNARAGSVIGVPIPDLRVFVLDQHLEPLPAGVAGELFVGGAGVGRGYLNLPALTAERFIPNPFSEGGRLYRSGDLARFTSRGDLEYLGRVDHQVKIRGFRIELGEIETALASHAAVGDALMIALDEPKRLVAYVTPRGDESIDVGALRRHVQARLPDYMWPSAFVVVDHMPLTPHGKIDRAALPSPSPEPIDETTFEPPRSHVEQVLAAAWAAAIGVPRIGRHDNFFVVGGDSIRSIKAIALARANGVEVSLQQLFEHQTIAGIAAELEATGVGTAALRESSAAPFSLVSEEDRRQIATQHGDAIEDAYPLALLQEGMLFRGAFDEQSTAYHNVSSFHVRVAFDEAAFTAAVEHLIERHPVLRASLHPTGYSTPLQIVHRDVALPLVVDDLRALPSLEQDRLVAAFLAEERLRRFEWTTAPLFRIHVHRRRDDEMQVTLTEHHAILDGWSVATLLSELMADYLGAIGVMPQTIRSAPVATFADYVRLEREELVGDESLAFWRERLSDTSAPPLPSLASRSAVREPGVIVHEMDIDPAVVSRLAASADAAQVPFRSVLLAAHVYLVGVLSSSNDAITGLVVNARPETTDAERALGLFLNTVPLRVPLTGGTWRALIQSVFETERTLIPHRGYPMAALQRTLGGAPLFHTVFNYVHFHAYERLTGLQGLDVLGQSGSAETDFPLAASFSKDAATGIVRLSLECAAPELDRAAVETVAGWYAATLAAIAESPGSRYDDWSPISQRERDGVESWSRGARVAPDAALAHERVAVHARNRPNAEAIVSGGNTLTYADLDRRATIVARALVDRGVGEETRVALLAPASPDLIVAMLAVWKAGGAFVPLDPAYPAERLRFMLQDAAPVLLLGARPLLSSVNGCTCPALALEDVVAGHAGGALPAPHADRLAYVIYTSGSTGEPKGVMVPHCGLRNLLHGQIPRFGLDASSRVLQFAALGFDAAISEIFTTLAAGGCLHLASRNALRDPAQLAGLLRDGRITTVTLPPAMLAAIPDATFPDLTTIVSAGEACRAEIVHRWAKGRRVLNAYGPTETSVCATMTGALEADGTTPPIGRPLENLDVRVLDSRLQHVPVGVTGELWVGGDSLARGYLGRPDLTAERFVPHPFSDTPGSRLYRTGDCARWRSDGQIEFVGRADDQVKVRGARVELGEIEAVLQRHPDVQQVAVVWLSGADGAGAGAESGRLVAYVEPREGGTRSADALRRHVAAALPDHAVPTIFVFLDALPLSPSGKIDRRALPAPTSERPLLDVAYAAPRGDTERVLTEIWAGVLKVDRVGVHDNFFRLGGDSILSLQVVSRARAAGLRLSPQQVFEHQTIAALADVATAVAGDMAARPVGSVVLTPIQRWFTELTIPSPHHWNQAILLETPPTADIFALDRAFAFVVSHHDAFRLRFTRESGAWHQSYGDAPASVAVEHVDLTSLAPERQMPALTEHATALQQSLDLAQGLLIRAAHYHFGPHLPGRFLLVAHHLVMDGVSWRVLLDDLQLAYDQAVQRHEIVLPGATASWQAWSHALTDRAADPRVRTTESFWTQIGASASPLPVTVPRTDRDNTEGDAATLDVLLDADDTRDLLHTVSPVYGTRTTEVLVAAVAQAIARWTGRTHIAIHLEGHGRDAAGQDLDVSRTVGWFTTLYPVLINTSRMATPGDALIEAKEQLRAVPDGASYGLLRYLSADAHVRAALAAAAPSEVSFNYLGQLDAALAADSPFRPAHEPIGPQRDPQAARPHLVDVVCSVEGGRLRMTWLYPERLIAHDTIAGVSSDARAALLELIAHCRDPKAGAFTPSDFPDMQFTRDELDALLDDLDERAESS